MQDQLGSFYPLVEGAVLGFAVGDALGVPTEFMERSELRKDPVRGMRAGGTHRQPAGTWSDDTSMILCTMDSIVEHGINYTDQMQRFADWLWSASNTAHDEVFDVGGTVKHAIFRFVKGVPALECGETAENTCGNGSLMRMIPTACYLAGQHGDAGLDDRAAEIIHNTSRCTHAHLRCQMACGVYCAVIIQMCWERELHHAVKQGICAALSYYRGKAEFSAVYPEFESLVNIETWGEDQIQSSGYVLHTLQSALWCLLTTCGYAACVLKAVNLGGDTDTTAAVAGGLAGLWYGAEEIPEDWAAATAKYKELQIRSRRFCHACLKRLENKTQ